MKFIRNSLILIVLSILILSIFYSYNQYTENVVNPSHPFTDQKPSPWVAYGDLEISSLKTSIRLFDNDNFWGITYESDILIRALSRTANHAQLQVSELNHGERSGKLQRSANFDYANGRALRDFIVLNGNYRLNAPRSNAIYTDNLPGKITLNLPIWTGKYVAFNDLNGGEMYFKNNPMRLIEGQAMQSTIFLAALSMLIAFIIFGAISNSFLIILFFAINLTIALTFYADFPWVKFYALLIIIYLNTYIFNIKIWSSQRSDLEKRSKNYAIRLLTLIAVISAIFLMGDSAKITTSAWSFLFFIFKAFFIYLIIYFLTSWGHYFIPLLKLSIFGKDQPLHELRILRTASILPSIGVKQAPQFLADIVINGETFKNISINTYIHHRAKNNKSLSGLTLRMDKNRNFIIF